MQIRVSDRMRKGDVATMVRQVAAIAIGRRPGLRAAFLTATVAAVLSACTSLGRPPDLEGLDRDIETLVHRHDIGGLGVAVIRDGAVVHLKTFGTRDAALRLPLKPDTTMVGASLTKAAFAVYVMRLVDDGVLDLDEPLATLLPQPLPAYPPYVDLAADDRWQQLTLRRLLDHTSGFANFRRFEADRKLRFHRDPGTRYGYSGEGFALAQFVVETRLGVDVGREMQRRVFDPLGMTRTSMTWRDDFASDAADGYLADGITRAHVRRRRVDAAGSMDTTLRDVASLMAGLVRGDALPARAKAEMVRRQLVIDSVAQFPTLDARRTEENAAIGLGYGLGWGVFETPRGHAFFKEGHDDGTANYAICIDAERSCVVLMSNSDRAEDVFATLVRRTIGVEIPWRWEGYGAPETLN